MKTIDLTKGDEKKLLIKMTIPMIWALLAAIGMSLADTFFVGQIGANALAAIGFTFPVVMIIMSLAFGLGIGASSFISRAVGNADHEKTKIYTTQSLLIASIVSLIITIVGLQTISSIFLTLGAPKALLPLIQQYMTIWYLGSFATIVLMVGSAAIRSTGNVILPSRIMIGASIVNLILDPILIFGYFGIPKMGLFGAGLATVIASFLAMIATIYTLVFHLKLIQFKNIINDFIRYATPILKISLPASLASLITPIGMAISTKLVANYGSHAVAGYSIASRIESFTLIIIMALSSIITSFAGQNWGAKRLDRLVKGFRISAKFAIIWAIIVAVCMWLFSNFILSLFTSEPEVIEAGYSYLMIIPITYGFVGFIMLVSSIANGIGYTKPALFMAISRLILIYLPLALILAYFFKLIGLYIATALANIIVGLFAYKWSNKKIKNNSTRNFKI